MKQHFQLLSGEGWARTGTTFRLKKTPKLHEAPTWGDFNRITWSEEVASLCLDCGRPCEKGKLGEAVGCACCGCKESPSSTRVREPSLLQGAIEGEPLSHCNAIASPAPFLPCYMWLTGVCMRVYACVPQASGQECLASRSRLEPGGSSGAYNGNGIFTSGTVYTDTTSITSFFHLVITFTCNPSGSPPECDATSTVDMFLNGANKLTRTADGIDSTNSKWSDISINFGEMYRDDPPASGVSATNYNQWGWIDDLRIYNRVLTPAEITQLAGQDGSAANLIAYYKFDDVDNPGLNSAPSATSIGDALSSTQPAISTSNAKFDGSAYFDKPVADNAGSGGKSIILDSNSANLYNALYHKSISITFWCKSITDGELEFGRVFYAAVNGQGRNERSFQMTHWQDQQLTLITSDRSTTYNQYATTQMPTFNTAWTHVAIVLEYQNQNWDLAEHAAQVYINGVLDVEFTNIYMPEITQNYDFYIGMWTESTQKREYDGYIDEFRIYDGVLSAGVIAVLAAQTSPEEVVFNTVGAEVLPCEACPASGCPGDVAADSGGGGGGRVCAADQYLSGTTCAACDAHKTSLAGSTDPTHCGCPPGSFSADSGASCTACTGNTYKSGIGDGIDLCVPCPGNSTIDPDRLPAPTRTSAAECECAAGFYGVPGDVHEYRIVRTDGGAGPVVFDTVQFLDASGGAVQIYAEDPAVKEPGGEAVAAPTPAPPPPDFASDAAYSALDNYAKTINQYLYDNDFASSSFWDKESLRDHPFQYQGTNPTSAGFADDYLIDNSLAVNTIQILFVGYTAAGDINGEWTVIRGDLLDTSGGWQTLGMQTDSFAWSGGTYLMFFTGSYAPGPIIFVDDSNADPSNNWHSAGPLYREAGGSASVSSHNHISRVFYRNIPGGPPPAYITSLETLAATTTGVSGWTLVRYLPACAVDTVCIYSGNDNFAGNYKLHEDTKLDTEEWSTGFEAASVSEVLLAKGTSTGFEKWVYALYAEIVPPSSGGWTLATSVLQSDSSASATTIDYYHSTSGRDSTPWIYPAKPSTDDDMVFLENNGYKTDSSSTREKTNSFDDGKSFYVLVR